MKNGEQIVIYSTPDGKANVVLYAKDGSVWINQNQLAELFDTSKQNIGQHFASILEEKELGVNLFVRNYFTTASNGKQYEVKFDKNRKEFEAKQADLDDLKLLEEKIKKK